MKCWQNEAGFTLVEVMVAMVILALALIPMLDLFINSTMVTVRAGKETTALNLAREKLEEFKGADFTSIASQTTRADVPNYPGYQWTWNVTTTSPTLKMVKVSVYYQDIGGERSVSLTMLKRKG